MCVCVFVCELMAISRLLMTTIPRQGFQAPPPFAEETHTHQCDLSEQTHEEQSVPTTKETTEMKVSKQQQIFKATVST